MNFSELIANIDINRFLASLKYMGLGMLGIFIVMGVIILSVLGLGSLTAKKKKKEENENN
ncbi:MAG: hypothetical protein J6Q78_03745 [Clostridia bacterium]|nr:hypothetical protein [Clostridia bacterium]